MARLCGAPKRKMQQLGQYFSRDTVDFIREAVMSLEPRENLQYLKGTGSPIFSVTLNSQKEIYLNEIVNRAGFN